MAGRRKLPDEKRRDKELRIRVSDDELELLSAAAGENLSTWARFKLVELAKKELAKKSKPKG